MHLGVLTLPMHPIGKDWRQSPREDREAFILADELDFVEGLCGEHLTDPEENITSSAMFLATLVDATRKIKLGAGAVNMPNQPRRSKRKSARSGPFSTPEWMGGTAILRAAR